MLPKPTVAVLALTVAAVLTPTFVLAAGCAKETTAAICAVGMVWDAPTASCVTPAT